MSDETQVTGSLIEVAGPADGADDDVDVAEAEGVIEGITDGIIEGIIEGGITDDEKQASSESSGTELFSKTYSLLFGNLAVVRTDCLKGHSQLPQAVPTVTSSQSR